MRISIRAFAAASLTAGALVLAGCGDMLSTEQLIDEDEFLDSCKSSFTAEGGPADLAQPYCDCTWAEVKEQNLSPTDLFDEDKIMEIALQCAGQVAEENGLAL